MSCVRLSSKSADGLALCLLQADPESTGRTRPGPTPGGEPDGSRERPQAGDTAAGAGGGGSRPRLGSHGLQRRQRRRRQHTAHALRGADRRRPSRARARARPTTRRRPRRRSRRTGRSSSTRRPPPRTNRPSWRTATRWLRSCRLQRRRARRAGGGGRSPRSSSPRPTAATVTYTLHPEGRHGPAERRRDRRRAGRHLEGVRQHAVRAGRVERQCVAGSGLLSALSWACCSCGHGLRQPPPGERLRAPAGPHARAEHRGTRSASASSPAPPARSAATPSPARATARRPTSTG